MSNQYSCFSQKNYDRIWDKSHADQNIFDYLIKGLENYSQRTFKKAKNLNRIFNLIKKKLNIFCDIELGE